MDDGIEDGMSQAEEKETYDFSCDTSLDFSLLSLFVVCRDRQQVLAGTCVGPRHNEAVANLHKSKRPHVRTSTRQQGQKGLEGALMFLMSYLYSLYIY